MVIHSRWIPVVLLVFAAAIRLWQFRGFMGSDDAIYAIRGLEVAAGNWIPSDYNGALRYGVNLPIAAAVGLFGQSEVVLAAWGLACSLGEIAMVYAYALRAWGTRTAVFACLVLACIPQHISSATDMAADAPFAAMLTLSMVLLYFGISNGKVLLLIVAGLAVGFAGWVKPEAALVFSMPFGIMALIFMHDRRQILWPVVAAAAVASLNLAMFAWAFGDPFYYVNVLSQQLKAGLVNPSSWQSYDANFYFRLLFVDGRTFWLAPMLALLGTWFALRSQEPPPWRTGYFTVLWISLLLLFFSVFIYSLTPLRLIPKQTNYALIFAAPVSVLAGLALARMRNWAAIALMALVGIGGVFLATLGGYGHHLHAATHRDTIHFAQANQSSVVFSASQTLNLNRAFDLMGQENADNLRPLKELAAVNGSLQAVPIGVQMIAAYYPGWPEARGDLARLINGKSSQCLQQIGEAVGQPNATENAAMRFVGTVRAFLPGWIDKQVRFTDKLLSPERVRFYAIDRVCLAKMQMLP